MKTAGVDDSDPEVLRPGAGLREPGRRRSAGILGGKVKAGDVVVIRYEGPRGGPGMQEMLYPTSYLKSKGLGKACALVTDGRFSGGTVGPVHRPRLARGGRRRRRSAWWRTATCIEIDIPSRTHPSRGRRRRTRRAAAPRWRRKGANAWKPAQARSRKVIYGAEGLRRDDHQRRQGRGARGEGVGETHVFVRASPTGPREAQPVASVNFNRLP